MPLRCGVPLYNEAADKTDAAQNVHSHGGCTRTETGFGQVAGREWRQMGTGASANQANGQALANICCRARGASKLLGGVAKHCREARTYIAYEARIGNYGVGCTEMRTWNIDSRQVHIVTAAGQGTTTPPRAGRRARRGCNGDAAGRNIEPEGCSDD